MAHKNLQPALEKLQEANRLIKVMWDESPESHMAAGCYKALNAITHVVHEEIAGCSKKDDYYTFTRLMEAYSWMADHYGMSFEEALRIGGVQYHLNKQPE